MTIYRVRKEVVNHTFVIEVVEKDDYVDIKIDGHRAHFKDNILQLLNPIKIARKKIDGMAVSDEIINEIQTGWKNVMEKRNEKERKKEADRPAPIINEHEFFRYFRGCDTGLIYPEERRKIIYAVLDTEIKPGKLFRGSRDESREFPGVHDSMIPEDYVTKELKNSELGEYYEYCAKGYSKIWFQDEFVFPKQIIEETKKKLDDIREKRKDENKQRIVELTNIASSTGQKQILREWSEECDDSNEECDIDNYSEYVMPDGSRIVEKNHTW